MAWPEEAGWLLNLRAEGHRGLSLRDEPESVMRVDAPPALKKPPVMLHAHAGIAPRGDGSALRVSGEALGLRRQRAQFRSLLRVFGEAEYRLYRRIGAAPVQGVTAVHATSATAPISDGPLASEDWWYSLSYFNGVLDSGFLPIGINGETHVRLNLDSDVAGGAVDGGPAPPIEVRAEPRAGGIVRIHAAWFGVRDGTEAFTIVATTNGSAPTPAPGGTPVVVQAMTGQSVSLLIADLPAASHNATVRALVQVRRGVTPNFIYSEGVEASAIADAQAPAAPVQGSAWPGFAPEEE